MNAIELRRLVMVAPPYNCLYNYEMLKDGGMKARVKNEFIHADEGGPISAAEVGRHVAILGSIALAKAMENSEPMYYLAVKAGLNRSNAKIYKSNFLEIKVKIIDFNNRKGSIAGIVRDDHAQLVYVVDVEYQILAIPLFEKLFSAHKNTFVSEGRDNPYLSRKKLSNIVIEHGIAKADYGLVSSKDCAGHFTEFQALPVAVIGNLYSSLGIEMYKRESGNIFQKFTVESARINAFRLAFSGEYVSIRAEIQKRKSADSILIYCQALVGKEVISDAEILLRGIIVPVRKRAITTEEFRGNRSV